MSLANGVHQRPVATTTRRYVMVVVAAVPLWWALGVEQFVYPVLLLPALLAVLASQKRVRVGPVLVALLAFLVVYLASALFIVEDDRYLTFLKNLATYVTAVMLLLVVPAVARTWPEVRSLACALAVAMAVAGVVGLLAITGLVRGPFQSPFGALLPASVAATALGSNIVERSFGWVSWFAGVGSYFRVNSVFLWPTSYASAIALALPVMAFVAATSRRRLARLVWWALVAVVAVNLVFTTGRMAWLALVVAAVLWFVFTRMRTTWTTRVVTAALAVVVAAAAVVVDPGLLDAPQVVEQAVFARGSGSPTSRWTIYERTLEGFVERPLLGWGTERNIAGVSEAFIYPAGSHSYYLATLYRQGVLGFVAFLVSWWTIWRATAQRRVPTRAPMEARAFVAVGRAVVVAALIMATTLAFDLDASLMLVWWCVVALIEAVGALEDSSPTGVAEEARHA